MSWQPIETAPKNPEGERDGPPILLWNEYNHQIVHGFWTTHICNGMIRTGWAIWQGYEATSIYPIKPYTGPTHWMPIPEPPEQTETKT